MSKDNWKRVINWRTLNRLPVGLNHKSLNKDFGCPLQYKVPDIGTKIKASVSTQGYSDSQKCKICNQLN